METSPTIGELAKALAAAQLDFQPVIKDVKNPYYGQMYADLSSVIKATQPALAKQGLVVIQTPQTNVEAQEAIITTRLVHSSGEWLSSDLNLPATMRGGNGERRFDAQSVGAAVTYGRRYGYQAIIGVCAEADDDGNALASTGNGKATATDRKAKTPQKPNATEITQIKEALVNTCKLLNAAGDKPVWGAKRLDEFAVQEYGAKADDLEIEPLRELLKKLSLKYDTVKAPKKGDPTEVERQAMIAKIMADHPDKLILSALKEKHNGVALNQLTLDALIILREYLEEQVPF